MISSQDARTMLDRAGALASGAADVAELSELRRASANRRAPGLEVRAQTDAAAAQALAAVALAVIAYQR
jgi:hypothetical protein